MPPELSEPDRPAGVLYVVATPIGNLADLTIRALRALREVDLIAAEDTRHTRKLLAAYDIHTRLVSYHAHSPARAGQQLLAELRAGRSVALVTDAGTPGISDPGSDLVAAAAAAGIRVEPVPGPSALTAALSVAGGRIPRFVFEGFLPRAAGERRRRLAALRGEERALVFYEATSRVVATLRALGEALGEERRVVVARELTKQHEEVFRGTLAEAAARFTAEPPRGEFVLVLEGAAAAGVAVGPEELVEQAAALLAAGFTPRDAARRLSEQGAPRGAAYQAALKAARRR
jgi:16S rRNA (cytidine1402-2'-O)-methyltransferase